MAATPVQLRPWRIKRLQYVVEIDQPDGTRVRDVTKYIKDALDRHLGKFPVDYRVLIDHPITITVKRVEP